MYILETISTGVHRQIRRNKGFTIVELLIVIVVVAILAAITVVAYNGIQQRAQAARLSSEISSLAKKLELFNVEFAYYPAAINDCPTPVMTNLCLATPADESYVYQANAAGTTRYGSSKALNASYELQINGANGGLYSSNAEKTTSVPNEFMQYIDLAPLIDRYGLKKYRLSFDIKSASVASQSTINVYFQNGSGTRYGGLMQNVNVSTSYQHYDIDFTPTLVDGAMTASILAFYGSYGTGNIPSVKNVRVAFAQ